MKLNLGCGKYPLEGFVNRDKQTGWMFENGLTEEDNSVEAITISHSLMYVDESEYIFVFKELYRVLQKGGVLRITEDETSNVLSERYGGHVDNVTLTNPKKMRKYMEYVGFKVFDVKPEETLYKDDSLIQNFHGVPPKVFHIEGIK
jgi:predicted SAM-dependent methyltransferase